MVYNIRIGGNRTYTFDTPAQAEHFIKGRRHSVVAYDPVKLQVIVKMNPADVHKAAGQSIAQDIGIGAYKGVLEPSYGIQAESLGNLEKIRQMLGQESLYVEGKGKASIIGQGWSEATPLVLVVRIFRKKLDPKEFMKFLTNSDYALFAGGTLKETHDGYIAESAVVFDTEKVTEPRMRRIESALKAIGVRSKVYVRNVR